MGELTFFAIGRLKGAVAAAPEAVVPSLQVVGETEARVLTGRRVARRDLCANPDDTFFGENLQFLQGESASFSDKRYKETFDTVQRDRLRPRISFDATSKESMVRTCCAGQH